MCFMCRYRGNEVNRRMHLFILQNIGYMDIQCISQEVSDYVLTKIPDAEGADAAAVFAHVESHMLHPRVRTAVLLRQLLQFASLLQRSMVVHQDDLCSIDKSNAELYLKVIGQIMVLYKIDPSQMLFTDEANKIGGGDDANAANAMLA